MIGLRSSLVALALSLGAVSTLCAQGEQRGPGPALEERVRQEISARWGVATTAIQLEWGRVREPFPLTDDTQAKLLGSGAGGSWIVAFEAPATGSEYRVQVRAGVVSRVPVAARRLERGVTLENSDIDYRSQVHWGPPRAAPEVGVGWVTRRALSAGEELRAPTVDRPQIIEAGQTVRVIYRTGSIQLSVRGKAGGSAAAGEEVWVRTESGQRLMGVAEAPGLIRIGVPGKGGSR